MDRREREQILGEWGVRQPSAREQGEARQLAEDLDGSPLAGRPLRARLRNFRPAVDGYVASMGGPLPYMRRLREIHDETAAHELRLEEAWRKLAMQCPANERLFRLRWTLLAERWNFTAVNELIERHNHYFPAEARLPMDPRTGDYVLVAGESYQRRPLDADWVLELFPPVLERAAA